MTISDQLVTWIEHSGLCLTLTKTGRKPAVCRIKGHCIFTDTAIGAEATGGSVFEALAKIHLDSSVRNSLNSRAFNTLVDKIESEV